MRNRETKLANIEYFLAEILPQEDILALNPELMTLSYLSKQEASPRPRILFQQQFSRSELSLLRPLLLQYPHYCPHEVLFASFYGGTFSEKEIDRARKRLQEALDYGIWDHEMRPVRNVLSRTRLKLQDFGMDIRSILELGYILLANEKGEK